MVALFCGMGVPDREEDLVSAGLKACEREVEGQGDLGVGIPGREAGAGEILLAAQHLARRVLEGEIGREPEFVLAVPRPLQDLADRLEIQVDDVPGPERIGSPGLVDPVARRVARDELDVFEEEGRPFPEGLERRPESGQGRRIITLGQGRLEARESGVEGAWFGLLSGTSEGYGQQGREAQDVAAFHGSPPFV